MNTYDWDKIEKLMLERERYLLDGPNVIHLQYYDDLLFEYNFEDFENKLKQVGLLLSRLKVRESDVVDCSYKFLPGIFILINQPLIGELIIDKSTCEKWNTIKCLIFNIWKNLNERSCGENISSEVNSRSSRYELKVNLDRNTSFSFKIPKDFNEGNCQYIMDKVFDFLRAQKLNDKYEFISQVYFETNEYKWLLKKIKKDN